MRLKINEDYFIETDAHNVTLRERYISKPKKEGEKGKVRHRTVGHYPNFEWAYRAFLRDYIQTSPDDLQFPALIARIEQAERFIQQAIAQQHKKR